MVKKFVPIFGKIVQCVMFLSKVFVEIIMNGSWTKCVSLNHILGIKGNLWGYKEGKGEDHN